MDVQLMATGKGLIKVLTIWKIAGWLFIACSPPAPEQDNLIGAGLFSQRPLVGIESTQATASSCLKREAFRTLNHAYLR